MAGRFVWTPEIDALLGKESDMAVATRLGLSHMHVLGRRRKLGIPPLHARERVAWTDEMDARLGTGPDKDVAAALGISEHHVVARRRKLNVLRITPTTDDAPGGAKVLLDKQLLARIADLEPLLVARFQRLGLPIRRLEPWQVIEAAVAYMTEQAAHGKLR